MIVTIRMARPKSDDRKAAILSAATRVIATQGLSAPTAVLAKEAGVSNGSLFTYFATKADLLNALYVDLKTEMASVATEGLSSDDDIKTQMRGVWIRSLNWTASCPQKRRTLAHLAVSDDITPESRQLGHQVMAGVARLLEQSRAQGPLRAAPLGFVAGLMNAMADATVDVMVNDPDNADRYCALGFDAMWRALA